MRDHTRREAAAHEIHAAWFIVPMSVAAAVLMALGTLAMEPEPPGPLPGTAQAQPAAPEPRPADPTPEVEHVQAF